MSFLSSLNISASGMTAQKARLDIVAENLANAETTRIEGADGANAGPYRRKMTVLEAVEGSDFRSILQKHAQQKQVGGVRVAEILEDETPFKLMYEPNHPDANEDGYVELPNVDRLKETVDGMAASRAYDANITAFNALKAMASKALEIGK